MGWDQYTGYGRVNAFEAVKAAKEGRIPPAADITAPDLFSSHRKRVVVKLVAGADWRLEVGRSEEPAESTAHRSARGARASARSSCRFARWAIAAGR